jgi:hypothetical protein
MAHFDFARPSGQYPPETVFTHVDAQRWDVAQSKAANGDLGGADAPTTPVILGGTAGVNLTTAGSTITGGVATAQGGRLVLGVNDWPQLSPARSRSILMPVWDARVSGTGSGSGLEATYIEALTSPSALHPLTSSGYVYQVSVPPRYLHHGANLAALTLRFRVRAPALPSTRLILGFVGINVAAAFQTLTPPATGVWTMWTAATAYPVGTYLVPTNARYTGFYYKATAIAGTGTTQATDTVAWPTTVGATVVDNAGANQITWTCIGQSGQFPIPASPATYYAGNAPQSLTMAFDGTNVIDKGTYRYVVTLQNTDSNLLLHSVRFDFTNITQLAPE